MNKKGPCRNNLSNNITATVNLFISMISLWIWFQSKTGIKVKNISDASTYVSKVNEKVMIFTVTRALVHLLHNRSKIKYEMPDVLILDQVFQAENLDHIRQLLTLT